MEGLIKFWALFSLRSGVCAIYGDYDCIIIPVIGFSVIHYNTHTIKGAS